MKNFLAFLAAFVLVVAAVGWYLGWYEITRTPLPSGRERVTIEIDREKVGEDLEKGSEKLKQLVDERLRKKTSEKGHGEEPAEPSGLPMP